MIFLQLPVYVVAASVTAKTAPVPDGQNPIQSTIPKWANKCTVVDLENGGIHCGTVGASEGDDAADVSHDAGKYVGQLADARFVKDSKAPRFGIGASKALVSARPPATTSSVSAKTVDGCTQCGHPDYPCYATYNSQGPTCWGFNQAGCDYYGGAFCTPAPCVVANCQTCTTDGQECQTCEAGYMGPSCVSEADFFADVTVQTLPDSGVVAVARSRRARRPEPIPKRLYFFPFMPADTHPPAPCRVRSRAWRCSPSLYAMLGEGFAGSGTPRGVASKYAAQAFTRAYKDDFHIVYIYPHAPLSGSNNHQEYWNADNLGGTTKMQGVICGGNPLTGGYYGASMHELTHNYVKPWSLLTSDNFCARAPGASRLRCAPLRSKLAGGAASH